MAQRLATGRAMAIGHVIPLAEHQMINPLFADFIAGAGETYSAAGYDMVLTVVPEREEADVYRTLARQRRVDGIIVHAPKLMDPRIDLLRKLGLPFLSHGRDSRPSSTTAGSTSTTAAPSCAPPSSCSTSATGASRC